MPVFSESLVRFKNVELFNLVADFGKQRLEKFQVAKLDNLRETLGILVADQKVTDLRIAEWEALGIVSQKE